MRRLKRHFKISNFWRKNKIKMILINHSKIKIIIKILLQALTMKIIKLKIKKMNWIKIQTIKRKHLYNKKENLFKKKKIRLIIKTMKFQLI